MALQHAQVTRALDAIARGLTPFVEERLETIYKDRWKKVVQDSFRGGRGQPQFSADDPNWDAHSLLTVMWDQWNSVFRHHLGHAERSLVSELRSFRNQWAHQEDFEFDDIYRIFDSAERLLAAVDSPEAQMVAHHKRELMRQEFDQELRAAYRRSKARRQIWQDIFIYTACCTAIVFAIMENLGSDGWVMAVGVVLTFIFLGWQRITEPPPAQFGAHECGGCGKIIYSAACPYCELATFAPTPKKQPIVMHEDDETSEEVAKQSAE